MMAPPIEIPVPDDVTRWLGKLVVVFSALDYYLAIGVGALAGIDNERDSVERTFRNTGGELRARYAKDFDALIGPLLLNPRYANGARDLVAVWSDLDARIRAAHEERNHLIHGAWLSGPSAILRWMRDPATRQPRLARFQISTDELQRFHGDVAILAAETIEFAYVAGGLAEAVHTNAPWRD